jgi:hypothetical protein
MLSGVLKINNRVPAGRTVACASATKRTKAQRRGVAARWALRSAVCVTDAPADNPSATEEETDKTGCRPPSRTPLSQPQITSDYWRIWFYLLESAGLAVQLVNSSHARQLAGRPKTDVRHEAHCHIARSAGRNERSYFWI